MAHLPRQAGYKKLSTAMANIRATVRAAVAACVISPESGLIFESKTKSLYYPERCYETILLPELDSGVPPAETASFRAWLPGGEVDQKAADAIEMLRMMRADVRRGLEPKKVKYYFEFSEMCSTNDSQD